MVKTAKKDLRTHNTRTSKRTSTPVKPAETKLSVRKSKSKAVSGSVTELPVLESRISSLEHIAEKNQSSAQPANTRSRRTHSPPGTTNQECSKKKVDDTESVSASRSFLDPDAFPDEQYANRQFSAMPTAVGALEHPKRKIPEEAQLTTMKPMQFPSLAPAAQVSTSPAARLKQRLIEEKAFPATTSDTAFVHQFVHPRDPDGASPSPTTSEVRKPNIDWSRCATADANRRPVDHRGFDPIFPAVLESSSSSAETEKPRREKLELKRNNSVEETDQQLTPKRPLITSSTVPLGSSSSSTSDVTSDSRRILATESRRLLPFGFAVKNLYNSSSGIPRSRQDCDTAIEKLFKNSLPIDYYQYLQLAQAQHQLNPDLEQMYLAMSVQSIYMNKLISRQGETSMNFGPNSDATPNHGFTVELAVKDVADVMLPSKQFFKIANFLKRAEESDWCSSSFDAHTRAIMLKVIGRLAEADPYFPTYSSASQSSKYLPLGDNFYESFTQFIIQGFAQPAERTLECRVKRNLKETAENFLDRLRKEKKERFGPNHVPELVADLRELISNGLRVLELKPKPNRDMGGK